jgi:hypothetical protein
MPFLSNKTRTILQHSGIFQLSGVHRSTSTGGPHQIKRSRDDPNARTASVIPQIGAEIAEKNHFWIETD